MDVKNKNTSPYLREEFGIYLSVYAYCQLPLYTSLQCQTKTLKRPLNKDCHDKQDSLIFTKQIWLFIKSNSEMLEKGFLLGSVIPLKFSHNKMI